MFTIHFATSDGPESRIAQTVFEAIRTGRKLEAAGAREIRIVDSDGDARSLAWWQAVILGKPASTP